MSARQKIAIVLLIAFLISGCSGTTSQFRALEGDEKALYSFVRVIIDDKDINHLEDSSKLVSNLEKVFSRSFENVSIQRGYKDPQPDDLVIRPIKLWYDARGEYHKKTCKLELLSIVS